MIEGNRRLDRSLPPRRLLRRLGAERLRVWRVHLLSFVTIFGLWHVMATHVTPSVLFAPPLPAVVRLWQLAVSGILFEHLSISLWRIATGFSIGSAIGIAVGLVMGNIPFMRHFLEPYVNFFRVIPGIALSTVAVIRFGIGETSNFFLIIYATVFMVSSTPWSASCRSHRTRSAPPSVSAPRLFRSSSTSRSRRPCPTS